LVGSPEGACLNRSVPRRAMAPSGRGSPKPSNRGWPADWAYEPATRTVLIKHTSVTRAIISCPPEETGEDGGRSNLNEIKTTPAPRGMPPNSIGKKHDSD